MNKPKAEARTMTVYRQTFEVEGKFHFPVDMLRYDSCFPASGEESGRLERALEVSKDGWRVRLARYTFTKTSPPTFDRWASFLASVDRSSVRTEKL